MSPDPSCLLFESIITWDPRHVRPNETGNESRHDHVFLTNGKEMWTARRMHLSISEGRQTSERWSSWYIYVFILRAQNDGDSGFLVISKQKKRFRSERIWKELRGEWMVSSLHSWNTCRRESLSPPLFHLKMTRNSFLHVSSWHVRCYPFLSLPGRFDVSHWETGLHGRYNSLSRFHSLLPYYSIEVEWALSLSLPPKTFHPDSRTSMQTGMRIMESIRNLFHFLFTSPEISLSLPDHLTIRSLIKGMQFASPALCVTYTHTHMLLLWQKHTHPVTNVHDNEGERSAVNSADYPNLNFNCQYVCDIPSDTNNQSGSMLCVTQQEGGRRPCIRNPLGGGSQHHAFNQ